MQNELTELIIERNHFENEMYDYLVTPLINESFWDPVIVSLTHEQISKMKIIESDDECSICNEHPKIFKELGCCKQLMCNDCIENWFLKSVKCPFCMGDLRN